MIRLVRHKTNDSGGNMGDQPIIGEIRDRLFSLQDPKYRELQIKILPNLEPESIIGVRTPELRQMAKELAVDILPRTSCTRSSSPA